MNHVELTVQELEAQAQACEARAQDYRAMAVELRALVVGGELKEGKKVLPPMTQMGRDHKTKNFSREKAQESQKVGKVKSGRCSLLGEFAPAVAVLKEPFGRDDVMRAAGAEKKRAENWLTRAHFKGWIKRMGHGVYERTGKFGVVAGDGGKVRAVRSPSPRPSPQGEGEAVGSPSGKVAGSGPSEREQRYRELREGMGKIHVPRIGEGMRPDGEEET